MGQRMTRPVKIGLLRGIDKQNGTNPSCSSCFSTLAKAVFFIEKGKIN